LAPAEIAFRGSLFAFRDSLLGLLILQAILRYSM